MENQATIHPTHPTERCGRSVKPCVGTSYLTIAGSCCLALALCEFLLMRKTGGEFDPLVAYERLKESPAWVRCLFCAASLTLAGFTVDLIGRVGASVVFACRRVERTSPQSWALCRLLIQTAFLILLVLCACLAPQILPHGWARFAFPTALLAPVCLAAIEFFKTN